MRYLPYPRSKPVTNPNSNPETPQNEPVGPCSSQSSSNLPSTTRKRVSNSGNPRKHTKNKILDRNSQFAMKALMQKNPDAFEVSIKETFGKISRYYLAVGISGYFGGKSNGSVNCGLHTNCFTHIPLFTSVARNFGRLYSDTKIDTETKNYKPFFNTMLPLLKDKVPGFFSSFVFGIKGYEKSDDHKFIELYIYMCLLIVQMKEVQSDTSIEILKKIISKLNIKWVLLIHPFQLKLNIGETIDIPVLSKTNLVHLFSG